MAFTSRPFWPLFTVLIAGCASATVQHTYIAPTPETVFTTTEQMTASPGQVIYVENRSSVPVTVYSIALRDCENVVGCNGPRAMHLNIGPDSRTVLARVEPANRQMGFRYHFSYGWRADSASTAALAALAAAGDSTAGMRLAAIRREEARRRGAVGAVDMDLTPSEVAGFGDRASSVRALPDSLTIQVGQRLSLDTVRVLLIGTLGETLGRIRGFQWRVSGSPAVAVVRPDTVVGASPGRATLQLKLRDDVLPAKPAVHVPMELPIIVRQP